VAAFTDTSRLSLNQYTTFNWTTKEAIEGCRKAGLHWIGLWRDKVEAQGLDETVKLLRDNDVQVSSLCRGGFFPAETQAKRDEAIEENERAIDECATLGTDTLVLVCGGIHANNDIDSARQMVFDGIATLIPYAQERGVKLGIEPLHPIYAADRNVIVTLGQSNDFALQLNKDFSSYSTPVGVVIDVFHVWWDPTVYEEIKRARGHTFGFHVCEWITPLPDTLKARGMMGNGHIEIRRLREAVEAEGYDGPIECEIFNQEIWDSPGAEVVELMKERYLEVC